MNYQPCIYTAGEGMPRLLCVFPIAAPFAVRVIAKGWKDDQLLPLYDELILHPDRAEYLYTHEHHQDGAS